MMKAHAVAQIVLIGILNNTIKHGNLHIFKNILKCSNIKIYHSLTK